MVTFTFAAIKLVLPSPRLNDTESLVIPAVIDHAKDGTIWAYRKLSIPLERLSLFFEHVNRPKILETITFLRASMGRQVQYLDYENLQWTGFIVNPPFDFTHSAIRNNQFTIEFEGTHA